jgi:uncharacterized protein YdaU (DUF1376 family)
VAELPILPIKTDAILADTGHLSPEEFGAYCRILFTMWRHGGKLPNEPAELARIVGISLTRWKRISAVVMRPITITEGQLSQKRLTATWLEVQSLRVERSRAANIRWQKERAMQVHMQTPMQKHANQNQIKIDSFLTTSRQSEPNGDGGPIEGSPLERSIRAKGWKP